LSDRALHVKQLDAPPEAGKIAVGSGSFFRSSGSGASASIGTPLCSCSSASFIYSKSGFGAAAALMVCAPALIAMLQFSYGYEKKESHLYMSFPLHVRVLPWL
jgi:hypothetical protein